MSTHATRQGRFAALLDARDAAEANPGRIVHDVCRVAWDDATIAVYLADQDRRVTFGADRPFVCQVARASADGQPRLYLALRDARDERVALSAPAHADDLAGLPVHSGASGVAVGLDSLGSLLVSALAMGARVAVSATHADELCRALPEPSLVARVAAHIALGPERPELDPTLSLDEVAARAAADERRRLLRAREAEPKRRPAARESSDPEVTIARLRARVAELEAELERAKEPGRELDVACPSCDAFGRESMLRLAPVARPERARGLAAMCAGCGWLGVVVVSRDPR